MYNEFVCISVPHNSDYVAKVHINGGFVMENQNFKMKIQDSFKIMGRGLVITGVIEEGCVRVGDLVSVADKGYFVVKGIESFRKLLEIAECGMTVGLLISGLNKKDIIAGEYVTIGASDNSQA